MGLLNVQIIRTIIPLMIIFTCPSDWIFSDLTTMFYVFFLFLLMLDCVIRDIGGSTKRRSFATNTVIWICLFIIFLCLIGVVQAIFGVNNTTISAAFVLMIYCNVYLCKSGKKCLRDNTTLTAIESDSLVFIFRVKHYLVVYIPLVFASIASTIWALHTYIYYKYVIANLFLNILLILYLLYVVPLQLLTEVKIDIERSGTAISTDFESEYLRFLRYPKFIHQTNHWIFGTILSKWSMLFIFSSAIDKVLYQDEEYNNIFTDDVKSEHMLDGYKRDVNSLIRIIITSNMLNKTLFKITVDEAKVLISLCCLYFSRVYNRFYDLTKFIKYFFIVTTSGLVFTYAIVSLGGCMLNNIQENQLSVYSHSNVNGYDKRVRYISGYQLFERYIGEDVELLCYNYLNHDVTLQWYRNNTLIRKVDDRITIVSSYAKFLTQSQESLLQIKMLKDEDFTSYMCVAEDIILVGNIKRLRKQVLQKYMVVSKPSIPDVYYVPLGSLLLYRTIVYATSAREDELSFKYTVNGVDVNDICVEGITSCNIFAFLFMERISRDLTVEFHKYSMLLKIISIDIRSCICSAMYGIHEITVYRSYFNKTSHKTEIHEIIFPKKFYFFPTDNSSKFEEDMFTDNLHRKYIAKLLNETDVSNIPTPFGNIRINSFTLVNYIFIGIFVVILSGFLKLINYITFLYCKLTIFQFRNKILFGVWRTPIPSIKSPTFAGIADVTDLWYDVYISYNENDYERANVVLSFIEENCKLTACFPDRDLSDKGGVSKYQLYTDATQQSNKMIVLLSKSYVEDSDCNDFQLVRCILPLLYQNLRPKKNLIIIKLDECDLPFQIKWDPCISIVKWLAEDDESNAKSTLKKYLYQ